MTAFGITLIILLIYIIVCVLVYNFLEKPGDFGEWIGFLLINALITMFICMIIFGGYKLYKSVDWYGFFNDKVV